MHLLSLFPQLLFLAPFGATLIRIALAVVISSDARHLFTYSDTRHRIGGVCAAALAILFLVGAWTQLVALFSAISWVIFLIYPYPDKSFSALPKSTIALAVVMSMTLIVTGAGAFAIDWPL